MIPISMSLQESKGRNDLRQILFRFENKRGFSAFVGERLWLA